MCGLRPSLGFHSRCACLQPTEDTRTDAAVEAQKCQAACWHVCNTSLWGMGVQNASRADVAPVCLILLPAAPYGSQALAWQSCCTLWWQ